MAHLAVLRLLKGNILDEIIGAEGEPGKGDGKIRKIQSLLQRCGPYSLKHNLPPFLLYVAIFNMFDYSVAFNDVNSYWDISLLQTKKALMRRGFFSYARVTKDEFCCFSVNTSLFCFMAFIEDSLRQVGATLSGDPPRDHGEYPSLPI